MKKTLLTTLLLGSITLAYGQQKTLSFDEAIQLTLTENPALRAAAYEEQTAERERKATYGLRLPQIGVTGAYAFMSQDIAIDMNGLKSPVQGIIGAFPSGSIPPAVLQQASELLKANWSMKLQDRSVGTVGGNITIPLYTGGKINAANNAAKIKIDEAKERGTQTRNALVSELVERYYGLSLARQVVEVRKQVWEGMQHHLSDARSLEANGIIATGERLYAEVHTAEAERDYLKALNNVETINSALCNTMNTDSTQVVPISTMFMLNDIEGIRYFKELAAEHNPQLKQVDLKKSLAQEGVRLQRADFAPQVALMGGGSFYNYQMTSLMPRWAVGAGVTFKIFDGLSREYKFSAAKSQVRQVEELSEQARHNIVTLIDKLYNEMSSYRQQLPSLEAAYKFAVEYLRIKEEAFKEGAAPSSDVVDARLNLARMKTERLQTAFYYDLMLSRLLEACGISEQFPDYAKRAAAMPITYE